MNFFCKTSVKHSNPFHHVTDNLAGISQILFVQSKMVGFLLLVISLQNPNMALAGIIAFGSIILFAKLCGFYIRKFSNCYWIYNPLLVGLSIGCLFRVDFKVAGLIVVMSILTILVTTFLESMLVSRGLPLLSLPFAIVSILVYMVAHSYGKLFSLALFTQTEPAFMTSLPIWLASFFRALGMIIFSPTVITGILIFVILLWFSRILLLLAIVCFFAGVYTQSCLDGTFETAITSSYSFNYILVGLATVTFLKPSLRTYALALLGVCVCVFFADATTKIAGFYRIPVFTLPFNISVILLMLTLRRFGYLDQNIELRETPEKSLSANLVSKQRFCIDKPAIGLPFAGQCTVYQGWDGEWTHNGKWRHAIDFVCCDENGSMHKSSGCCLEDHLIFGMDILAPVGGCVVSCCDYLPDNPVGNVDHINNWGNHIILRSPEGIHVELSHLMAKSLLVKQGDYVSPGQILAKCGNSGFSPVPHLHIQVQRSCYLGDDTIPFTFTMFHSGGDLRLRSCPLHGEVIRAVKYSADRQFLCTMPLGKVFEFDMLSPDTESNCRFRVCRDQYLSAKTYLEDEDGSRLYFGVLHGSFRFYDYRGSNTSPLHLLYLAMPSFPLIETENFHWQEALPVNLVYGKFQSQLRLFAASFLPGYKCPVGEWHCTGHNIHGVIRTGTSIVKTSLRLIPDAGIKTISVGNITLINKGVHYENHNANCHPNWSTSGNLHPHQCPDLVKGNI